MATSHGADLNSNPDRSDNEPQYFIQPQHTYWCFSLSALLASFAQTLYNCFTTPPLPSTGIESTDLISPSAPVSPGSYPLKASSLATVVPLEHPTTTSQQAISSSNRDINDSDTIHISTSQRNTSQDQQERLSSVATTPEVQSQDLYRSANTAIFDDHEGFHRPGQGTVTPSSAAPSMFQGARGFNISGNPHFVNIGSVMNNLGGSHGLESMERFVSFAALYNSSAQDPDRRCHPGTRKTVLSRLQYWIGNPKAAEPIFWMHGPAGAGKTAIAQTIAHSFGRDKVAATFFFYRSDAARNDGNRLFITLAWQLAFSIPATKHHIANALGNQPDIPMKDVETQFEELIVRPFQSLDEAVSPKVVIIDGIDECTDERLQQRFLKLIGDAVSDCRVPLRFLISSRSEAHIQETVDRFECPVLQVDLAKLDDANHDIEKYLRDEFSRIASEQGLEKTWPGEQIIQDLVEKSSGQFVYASTVIRYVGDPHNSAITQLDIVRGLKPARGKLPFAELDALYLEILNRQPDQEFLMEFLNLLVARSLISVSDLQQDDATLMEISDKELHRKLRGMRSLLKFDPFIDVYHLSFLDFLQDSLRPGQYHINKQSATKRYLELITGSVIRYASRIIEQPNYHETHHFHPQFFQVARDYPRRIELSVDNWQEVLRPLVDFQDDLLNIPDFTSTWELLPCDKCMVFHIIRHLLLHLAYLQGTSHSTSFSIRLTESFSNESAGEANMVTPTEAERSAIEQDLDGCLSSLLSHLREMKLELSVNVTSINLLHTLLHFDYAETVMRIRSVSDAQNLIDLIDFLNNNEYFLNHYGPDVARKAARLGLEIFAKVPVLPRSLFLSSDVRPCHGWLYRLLADFEILCQSALMGRILDHEYVVPLLWIQDSSILPTFVGGNVNETNESLSEWQDRTKPSAGRRVQVMFKVAKTIQYFHSMGVVFHFSTGSDDIFLDSEFRAKVHILGTTARYIRETPLSYHVFRYLDKIHYSNEYNIFIFGRLFHQMYFDRDIDLLDRVKPQNTIAKKPSEPEICEDVWQLVQRCCAEDLRSIPSIDEIVQEMESWKIA